MSRARVWVTMLFVAGCTEKPQVPAPRVPPKPLQPLARVAAADDGAESSDALHQVVALKPVGPALPEGATVVELEADQAKVDGKPIGVRELKSPLLLVPVKDTYLVQAAVHLAQFDDADLDVWLKHPDVDIAFRLTLRDEPEFQKWLDEPVPGKVRVIQRADGFELQTNMGKVHGVDPNGPTVPPRGGAMDLSTLRRGLERAQARFPSAPDYCFLPSFGMELAQTARAMAANTLSETSGYFRETCLVYPRPPP